MLVEGRSGLIRERGRGNAHAENLSIHICRLRSHLMHSSNYFPR